ncbi:conjugal transfer protein TrbG [Legionella birminghamensis]|uniref:Conjugal transfer protein TrbG n=1 Tax=Legionella birminghamensis TaxID=28083 RepID=A0A378IC58_9GAMM|nr:hypothetical protein [Legionella birminghamensis]KTC70138.1 conjugal transfer protein TrbG [Legionella birminghamensis]STX32808.1 Conjugative transfer protein TrbG [Legionella birminghamensis]
MKRIMQLFCLLTPLTSFALDNTILAEHYFSDTVPKLSSQEKQGLDIAERTQQGKNGDSYCHHRWAGLIRYH